MGWVVNTMGHRPFGPFKRFGESPFSEAGDMNDTEFLLLLSGSAPPYLLRDDFTTPAAAPLGSPLAAEPGPGSWTILDTGNKLSKSGGLFVLNGMQVSSTATPDPRASMSFARVAGRAFAVKFSYSAERVMMGWYNTAGADLNDISVSFQILSSVFQLMNISGNTGINVGATATATDYQVVFVVFATGGAFFAKGGADSSWALKALVRVGTAAIIYATFTAFSVSAAYSPDTARVVDLPSSFQSAANLSVFTDTTLASGDSFTGSADGITEYAFTLSGAPSANDEGAVLYLRWIDDNNCVRFIVKRNAGNTAWDLQFRKVTGGVETTPAGWTDVTGVGTPDLLWVKHVGSVYDAYTQASGVQTKRGAQVTLNFQNTTTGIEIKATVGATLTRVANYAYNSAIYTAELDKYFL